MRRYETNTHFRRCIRLTMTDTTSLDEFNSFHTSHNRFYSSCESVESKPSMLTLITVIAEHVNADHSYR